jgi:hypothetical protein
VELSQRLALTGVLGLAALSATHGMRGSIPEPDALLAYVLGVMPNLAAAFAMPLVLASSLGLTSGRHITARSTHSFLRILLFAAVGLCAWEAVQIRSDRFRFDLRDLGATGLSSLMAHLACR